MRTLTPILLSLLVLASLPGSLGRLLPATSHASSHLATSSLVDGDGKGGGDDKGDKGGDDDDDDEDFRVVG
ncbi:hypothetical protein F0U60_08770 [Archangium minus]|uniref:Uncharacterized protein n=1 Tax=Archangium minus TaxID=83450 RepID=A0ABY9WMY2_9BACT|nr:hypothetical protein F0U61_08755 [Archangium violaceum]WNG44187.1 hypothetical protein F0U60_08770 [Archangium minus]